MSPAKTCRSPVPLRPLALCVSLALGTCLAITVPQAVAAEQDQAGLHDYQLAAGPMAQQLNRFAAQSGIYLAADSALTQGKQSNALRGRFSVERGLELLLDGTGVQAIRAEEGHYELRLAPDSPMEMSAVTISGKAPGSTTEGTGSYTTYSSSSSTRLNLTPQETPQSVTVLTRQRLDDQKLDRLSDALEATAGITVIRSGLGADTEGFWSRGFLINNFETDGVPTSSLLGNYLQSTAMYDRVEVVRGATGLISGLGNPSATINLIRKRPTYEPKASVTAEAGSWDRYGAGLDVSGPLNDQGNARGRLVMDYKTQRAWIDRYDRQTGLIYGISEFDLSEATLLTLGFSYLKEDVNTPMRSGFPLEYSNGQRLDVKRSANSAPDWSYYDNELENVFASLEHHFDNGWSGKAEYSHSQYRYDGIVTYMTGSADAATGSGLSILPTRWEAEPQQDNLDLYLTGPFSLFGAEHELIGGMTLSQVRELDTPDYGGWLYDGYDGSIPDIRDWDGQVAKPGFTQYGESDTRENQYAAYLTSRFHLGDATNLILGGRVVDWKRTQESHPYEGADSKNKERESGVFIPYTGITYALDDVWSLYASYTKIFNPQGSWVRDRNNQPLDPEEGTSYEAGIKAAFADGRLNSSLALFKTEQDNLAIWDGVAYSAAQGATTKGVELELNGELAEGWQLTSGYAYSVTTNKDDERIVTDLPRHSLKTFTTYRLPGEWDKLTVGGGFNWQSKTGADLKYHTQDSYYVANLMARYQLTPQLSVAANLNNVFDREYYSSVGTYAVYGAPRNLMTSMKYDF
ncbi:TonB-dependent siderophore receptor [Enterobacterales bacterium AE_CKDN230030158-1A_HGKHYDSX7]